MELKEFVKIFKFDKSKADEILDVFANKPGWQRHHWIRYESEYNFPELGIEPEVYYTNPDEEGSPLLVELIQDSIDKYNKFVELKGCTTFPGQTVVNRFNFPRFNKYQEGTLMRKHYDHIKLWGNETDSGIPILTMLVGLNDDYEGGELILAGDSYKLKAGDFMCFPSSFLYPHEVKPITKGTRYNMVAWGW